MHPDLNYPENTMYSSYVSLVSWPDPLKSDPKEFAKQKHETLSFLFKKTKKKQMCRQDSKFKEVSEATILGQAEKSF